MGWSRVTEQDGAVYYWHEASGQSRWEPPPHSTPNGCGGARLGHRMCEGCGAKQASFGTPTERKRRWCSGCGKSHGAISLVPTLLRGPAKLPRRDDPGGREARVHPTSGNVHRLPRTRGEEDGRRRDGGRCRLTWPACWALRGLGRGWARSRARRGTRHPLGARPKQPPRFARPKQNKVFVAAVPLAPRLGAHESTPALAVRAVLHLLPFFKPKTAYEIMSGDWSSD
eukprot:COSAG06_NODE_20280_length_802_cov_0.665718_1_plen_226_part_10